MSANSLEILRNRFPSLGMSFEPRRPNREAVAFDCRAGAVDWDQLVDRWLSNLELKENSLVALSGFGDGSHVKRLFQALPKGCFVFCAEKDPAHFREAVDSGAFEDLFADPRFFLGVGPLGDAFFEPVAAMPVLDSNDVLPVIFGPSYHQDEPFYSNFFMEFVRRLDFWRKLYGTNIVSSGAWQRNTIRNLPFLANCPDLNSLNEWFTGVDIALVSAGPSLDESLELLKRVKERALIIAVNSSYQALRNAGIVPHFVLAADPNKETATGFLKVDCDETLLICPFMVNPQVVRKFTPRAYTWSENNLLVSYLRLKCGLGIGAGVAEQGTVSACIFDVAKTFGSPRIFLFGQDLAVRDDGQSHASDSIYTDLNLNRTDLNRCRMLPGNTIPSVPVEEKLYVYLKTFEKLVNGHSETIEVWNTSRLGAKIAGVPYIDLKEADGMMASNRAVEIESLMIKARAACLTENENWTQFRTELEQFSAFAKRICSAALKSAVRLEGAHEDADGRSRSIRAVLEAKSTLEQLFDEFRDYYSVMNDGDLKYEMLQFSKIRRQLNQVPDPSARSLSELKEYMWALAEGSFKLLNALETTLGSGAHACGGSA